MQQDGAMLLDSFLHCPFPLTPASSEAVCGFEIGGSIDRNANWYADVQGILSGRELRMLPIPAFWVIATLSTQPGRRRHNRHRGSGCRTRLRALSIRALGIILLRQS